MTILTCTRIKEAGACREQLALFKRKYGESVIVTVEAAQEVAAEFSWDWARCLLDAPARRTYVDEAIAPARRTYVEAVAPARRTYVDEAIAPARRAYVKAVASASRTYDEAIASASRTYDEALASAWAQAFIESEARK